MSNTETEWDVRASELWATFDHYQPDAFIAEINALVAELPSGSAIGLFEQGCAQDSIGHSELAIPLYHSALQAGLQGIRRRRAVIQMSSSLRNIGNADEAAELLADELQLESDELDGAVQAFLALALTDLGREREAVAHALTALSSYLPRYNRSLANYAQNLK